MDHEIELSEESIAFLLGVYLSEQGDHQDGFYEGHLTLEVQEDGVLVRFNNPTRVSAMELN